MTLVGQANRTLILALLCVASFAVVFNNLIITPILPDISDDLGISVGVAGLLVTAYAMVGGIAAIFSGPIIDRLGRKPVVVVGMSILAVATVLSAIAPTFGLLMASRALAGLGVACLTPAVFSAVGDYFAWEERGRAMSWVITANTSASILGVPAGALVSGLFSWRITFTLLAALCLLFTFLLFTKLPGEQKREAGAPTPGMGAILQVLRDKPTAMAIYSSHMATCYWFVIITYVGAYYRDEFGVSKSALGVVTMLMGVGVLIGSNVGGRLSDRIGKRPVIVATSAACAGLAILEMNAPWLLAAAPLMLVFGAFGGARFATHQAVLTEMRPQSRGTVMALNAAGQQFGIVLGSAIGGLVLSQFNYGALGFASAVLALVSLFTYSLFVDEKRFTQEAEAPGMGERVEVAAAGAK